MYPFSSLPDNLAAFCRVLNRDHSYRVGPRELQDAARALQVTSLGEEQVVRDALRPVLSMTRDDALVFDRAFQAFFHPVAGPAATGEPASARREWDSGALGRKERVVHHQPAAPPLNTEPGREADGVTSALVPAADDEGNVLAAQLQALYSPCEGQSAAPALEPVDAAWRDAARAFVRRIETGRARTWRPAPRGPRFDLRRTLRTSLHTSGEVVLTRWQARPPRHPRFVVLIDGSRSMGTAVHPVLELAVALASVTSSVETFVFSTALRRVTPDVKRAASGERRPLVELGHAWGGGTSLGGCLADLLHTSGERLVTRHTVVIIASDGLDTGAPDLLRGAMSRLHQVTAAVVWLNPLIETRGYEPTAQGMRTARPYVTTLAWVAEAAAVRQLAQTLRLRR